MIIIFLFCIISSGLARKDVTFDLSSNWQIQTYESQFNNSFVDIKRIKNTELNETYTLKVFQSVHPMQWVMSVFLQNQFVDSWVVIQDLFIQVQYESTLDVTVGAILKYADCVYLGYLSNSTNMAILSSWETFPNSYVPSSKSILSPPEDSPLQQQFLVSATVYGFWILTHCPLNHTCNSSVEVSSFEEDLWMDDATFTMFTVYYSIVFVILFYMSCFVFCTINYQTPCKETDCYCHFEEDIHDTISSSIHDANSIPKRIFNIFIVTLSIIILFSDIDTFLLAPQSTKNIVVFVFECLGFIFLTSVACFPGGRAYRQATGIDSRTNNPLLSWFYCVDKIHSITATLGIAMYIVANGINVIPRLKPFSYKVSYIFDLSLWVISVGSLLFFIYYQNSSNKDSARVTYLSEALTLSAIVVQNLFVAWTSHPNFHWHTTEFFLLYVLFLVPYMGIFYLLILYLKIKLAKESEEKKVKEIENETLIK